MDVQVIVAGLSTTIIPAIFAIAIFGDLKIVTWNIERGVRLSAIASRTVTANRCLDG